MSGANAISWGYNPSLNADQYYQKYMQWSQTLDQQAAAKATTQSGQAAQGTANPIFQGGAPTQAAQQKESHTGRNLLLFAGATAAILAGVAMHNGGGIRNAFKTGTVFSSMKKGFSNMWNGIKGSAKNITGSNTFTISENGNCTVPGKLFNREAGAVASEAASYGAKVTEFLSGAVPKNAKIREYSFVQDGYNVMVKNGVVTSVEKGGKNILHELKTTTDKAQEALYKAIKDGVEKVAKGNTTGIKVQSYKLTENGVTSLFKASSTDPNKFELTKFVTKNFKKDSDAVLAYAEKNPLAKALLEAFNKGERKDLKVIAAELESAGLGTFKIENGKIVGITDADGYHICSSDRFLALKNQHEDIFENVLKDTEHYRNIVYSI